MKFLKGIFAKAKKPTLPDVLIHAGILKSMDEVGLPVFSDEIVQKIPDQEKQVLLYTTLMDTAAYLLLHKYGDIDVSDRIHTNEGAFEILQLDDGGLWQGNLNKKIQTAIDKMFPDIGAIKKR